jgi:subtilisin family serine protease
MKREFVTGAMMGALLSLTAASAHASVVDDFFTPDLTSAELAESLTVTGNGTPGLPGVTGFWTDLVDTENVSETGEGVYVAVLDTGLLPQAPFFFSQANIAWNLGMGFTHDAHWDNNINDLVIGPVRNDRGFITDLASGHGTHVASTIVGFNINNQVWVDGVAPDATIIPVLVLDGWHIDTPFGPIQFEGGSDAMIAGGLNYIGDLAAVLDGPVVINMSLGGPTPSLEIEAAINYAISQGVVVVVSAGNSGSDGMGYPGGLEQVISAGAAGWASMFNNGWNADAPENLKKKDALGNASHLYLENFSSRPNPDLDQSHQDLDVSAPGAWMVGPFKSAFANDLNYYYLSGTSMAAPCVSGIAALTLEAHPTFDQSKMEFVLRTAASGMSLPASDAFVTFPFIPELGYEAEWDGGDYGRGFLQADRALQMASFLQ